ncbi:MAG: hypothetical protein NC930_07595 [Candidatus Omnitrophica bacterium]|nr:hypothetical protein [Candidatus Omnitrophota bacterium]
MGLYRASDVRAYIILSILANFMIAGALFLIAAFHFYESRIAYRNVAFVCMLLSIILRYQMTMQKVEILEKRVATFTGAELPGGKIAASTGNIALVFYLTFFWLTMVFALLSFLPSDFHLSDYLTWK